MDKFLRQEHDIKESYSENVQKLSASKKRNILPQSSVKTEYSSIYWRGNESLSFKGMPKC